MGCDFDKERVKKLDHLPNGTDRAKDETPRKAVADHKHQYRWVFITDNDPDPECDPHPNYAMEYVCIVCGKVRKAASVRTGSDGVSLAECLLFSSDSKSGPITPRRSA